MKQSFVGIGLAEGKYSLQRSDFTNFAMERFWHLSFFYNMDTRGSLVQNYIYDKRSVLFCLTFC